MFTAIIVDRFIIGMIATFNYEKYLHSPSVRTPTSISDTEPEDTYVSSPPQ